jgi:hypothetical protein
VAKALNLRLIPPPLEDFVDFSLRLFRTYARLRCFSVFERPERPRKAGMFDDGVPPRRRRMRGLGLTLRRRRTFARLREGLTYEEFAGEEGVTSAEVEGREEKHCEVSKYRRIRPNPLNNNNFAF